MGKNNDPLARAEEVGQQVFEAVASGLTEVVGKLQALAEQIEQKVEEQLRTSAGNPPPAGPSAKSGKSGSGGAKKSVKAAAPVKKAEKSAKPKSAKKSSGKKTSAKKTSAKKSGAKSSGTKSSAKKPAAKAGSTKKKASAKKSASKTSASKTSTSKTSGPTKDELYEQAQKLDIAGRSAMSKAQLAAAVARATK